MSEFTQQVSDPYRVEPGDTLSAIARRAGTSVSALQRLNGIAQPDKLQVGRVLYLSPRSAFGVSVLFLDALRYPIANLPYQLRFDGRTVTGVTAAAGTVPRQTTRDSKSAVEVWIKDAQAGWQQVQSTVSGLGHKLITLVSDAIVIKASTEPHPPGAPAVPAQPVQKTATATQQAAPPAKPQGAPSKNNPAVKTRPKKGPQGQPIIEVGIEIPQGLLDLFAVFKGGEISDESWQRTAITLGCEKEVLMAIAKVESGGRNAFWRVNRGDGAHIPAILYERHYFSRLTGHKYDDDHPDISWRYPYRKKFQLGDADNKMHDRRVEPTDVYSDYATSYLRLINAYKLDANAALQSCSWGKFQVMGENFELCGIRNARGFVEKMCVSEAGQIELLSGFIQNQPLQWKDLKNKKLGKEISLWEAVKNKSWKAIAFNYNGGSYALYSYDTQIEKAYESYKALHKK